jgi:hypothetical protein
MAPNPLIPSPEAIPAPAWVFHILDVVLFAVHLLLMNILVGGTALVVAGKFRTIPSAPHVSDAVAGKLPTFFAWTVTMGIAPLLFVQVIYGNLFYTSSILMGGYWLLVIPCLIAAYYAVYIQANGTTTAVVRTAGIFSLLILFYVAYAYVNNLTLMMHPEHWQGYFSNREGTILNLADPTLIPRYLHFAVGALAVGSLAAAFLWSLRRGVSDEAKNEQSAAGLRIFAYATLLQAVIGFWFLFAIPREQRMPLIAEFGVAPVILGIGILAGAGAVVSAFRRRLRPTLIQAGIAFAAMILTRDQLRTLTLAGVADPARLPINPQYGVMALFLIVLIVGLVAVGWMLKLGFRAGTEGGAR